jgi:uncharacterized membrane protein
MTKRRNGSAAGVAPPAAEAKARAGLDWPRWVSLGLALAGAAVAGFLTWIKVAQMTAAVCGEGGGCDIVNSSIYSEINGIPVAAIGLGAYLAMAALLVLEGRSALATEYGPLAVFGLALTGTLYSAYLTYVELAVIHAICPYCVVSAVLIAALLVLSVIRLARGARA